LIRELNLAQYYFANLAGKFVNIQSNMNFYKAIKSLKSTAWDLLLLRLPEQLLTPYDLPEINMAYVVTSEEKLLSIGNMFGVEPLFFKDIKSLPSVFLSFNNEDFENIISQDNIQKLRDERIELTLERSRMDKEPIIAEGKLDWLIDDLEKQMKYLCKK
jgi:hypothetical protein